MQSQAIKQTSFSHNLRPGVDDNLRNSDRSYNLSKNGKQIIKQSSSPQKTPRNLGSSHYSHQGKQKSRGPGGPSVALESLGLGESQIMQSGAFVTPIERSPLLNNRQPSSKEKDQPQKIEKGLPDLETPTKVQNQMEKVIQNIESLQQQLAHHEFQKLGQNQNPNDYIHTQGILQGNNEDSNTQFRIIDGGQVQIIPDIQMVKNYADGYQNLYKGQPHKTGGLKLPNILESNSFLQGPSATSHRRASSLHQHENYNLENQLDGKKSGLNYAAATSTNRSVFNKQQSALSRIRDGTGSVLDILRQTDRDFKNKSLHLKIEPDSQHKLNKTIRTERFERFNRSVIDKFDRLNPQNILANQSFQQRILGRGKAKIGFDLNSKYKQTNQPQMEGSKQPVADTKKKTMLRIMDNFREDLYGSSLQYQLDGSVGPAPTKKVDRPRKLSKGNSSIQDYRLASMSTLAKEALDLDELRQLQEYGERHNIIEVSATSLMNDTGFTSIKQKLHTYLSPERLRRKSQTSLSMLATHQTGNRKVNPLDRSFEGVQGGSEENYGQNVQASPPKKILKFQTLEPEKSADLPKIQASAIPFFNANQSVQQFYFGDNKIDGQIDRMNTTNYLSIAQSAVQGRASPLIASKLMKSYYDKKPVDMRGQTVKEYGLGFGQSSVQAAFNLTSSSNAFVRKPGFKKQGGHFEEFQRKLVTFNSPNPIADRKHLKKQKMAILEVKNKALLAAQNSAVTTTIEVEPIPGLSATLPGTTNQKAESVIELSKTVQIKTKSNIKDTRRSQGSQKSIASSKQGQVENQSGIKLNTSSAIKIKEVTSPVPRLDGGTQLITEEVAAAIGVKPIVNGTEEPSGEPAADPNLESNENLQIAPIEPNIKLEKQSQQENGLKGGDSRNLNQTVLRKNSKTTVGEGTLNLKSKGGTNSRSKSPQQKRNQFTQHKKRPPSNDNTVHLQHVSEKIDDKLGSNRLKQIYILNQATIPQYKLANQGLKKESYGTSSHGLETVSVGSRESPSKRVNQKQIALVSNQQVQFQVQGSQKPVASMSTWFQGQQQQLRQKKKATARLRLMENRSTLKPTSNYPTSQTFDYLSASGTLTKDQLQRPRIMVPGGERPFEDIQLDTIQTSMRRDESRSPGERTIPTQQVTPPRNTAEQIQLAHAQQTQSNEYLLLSVGTNNISPQSRQSSRNINQTDQSYRSQDRSPLSGNRILPTVFPAPEYINNQVFPKKNSLAKWEPSAQQSNANLATKSQPRQHVDIKGVTEEDSVTQNLTAQQLQGGGDSSGNLAHDQQLRSFAPRIFDSSLNLNQLSEAIRSPKGASGEPEKVFIINHEEKQSLLTLKNIPPGLKKQLRNHKRQATIQQQLSKRNQMSRIDVVFPGQPRRPSQYQINTESGHEQSFQINHQNSQIKNGPIYMLDGQYPSGSQTTLDGHILVQVQNPLNQSSRANISMTHHLPQAHPIPNNQKYKIGNNIQVNQNCIQHNVFPTQISGAPIENLNQPLALQGISSFSQLQPGKIKEVELSSEGDNREDRSSPQSKHIVQMVDSNMGMTPQGREQLQHFTSLQSLGVNNQASTQNITEHLSPPGFPNDRNHPVVNFKRAEAKSGLRVSNEVGQVQSKVNVVNIDFKMENESKTSGTKIGMKEQYDGNQGDQRKGSVLRDANHYSKQRPDRDIEDDDFLRKGTFIIDKDSINSSPSHEPKHINSKFPRNQSLVSSMKLDYTLKGKQIEQGLLPLLQTGQSSDRAPDNIQGGESTMNSVVRNDDQLPNTSVQVITSQVGHAQNLKSAPQASETSPTKQHEQSVAAYNAQDQKISLKNSIKNSISVSPIKDPAKKAQDDKQYMSQTLPDKWNGAVPGDGVDSSQAHGLSPSAINSSPFIKEGDQRSSSVTGQDPTSRLTVLTEQEEAIQGPVKLATEIISGEVAGFADSANPATFQEKSPRNRRPLPQLGMTQTVLNKDLLAPESPRGQHRGMPKPKSIKRRNVNRGASNTKKTTVFNNQMIRDLQK